METLSALLALCVGNSPVTGEFPWQRPVTRALMFSLIYARINDWVKDHEAGHLRRHRAHYDVTVMNSACIHISCWLLTICEIQEPDSMAHIILLWILRNAYTNQICPFGQIRPYKSVWYMWHEIKWLTYGNWSMNKITDIYLLIPTWTKSVIL